MNGKKDRSLNIIFENCIEESPAPDQGVINQAIALLEEKNTINDRAVSDHKRRSYTFFKKRYFKIGLSVGLSMCLCLAVCFGLLFSRNIKSSAQKVVQRSEVVQNAVHTQFQDSGFLPFVEEDSVTDYREYELSDQSEYYEEYGDSVIFYYLQYVDRGTDIELFVGVDWCFVYKKERLKLLRRIKFYESGNVDLFCFSGNGVAVLLHNSKTLPLDRIACFQSRFLCGDQQISDCFRADNIVKRLSCGAVFYQRSRCGS